MTTPPWALDRVGFTRGEGCADIAELLAPSNGVRIDGDLQTSTVTHRLDALVTRKLTSFDLVPVVIPEGVDLPQTRCVVAAVGDGPHSPLAVNVAARLGASLDVPVEAATVYRTEEEADPATTALGELADRHDNVTPRAVMGSSVTALIEDMTPSCLLIIGAPGGSWLQRQFFGPGHRLTVTAPAGIIVVRSTPRRCFHTATAPEGQVAGVHMSVGAALDLLPYPVVVVVDEGLVVGVAHREALVATDPQQSISEVMEPPVDLAASEPLDEIEALREFFEGSPIPVSLPGGRLIGVIL